MKKKRVPHLSLSLNWNRPKPLTIKSNQVLQCSDNPEGKTRQSTQSLFQVAPRTILLVCFLPLRSVEFLYWYFHIKTLNASNFSRCFDLVCFANFNMRIEFRTALFLRHFGNPDKRRARRLSPVEHRIQNSKK